MRKQMRFQMMLVFFLIIQTLPALTVEELLQDVQAKQARIASYQTEVTTTVESSLLGRRTQQGRAYYQAPDRLRTDSFNPHQTLLKLGDKNYSIFTGQIEELAAAQNLSASWQKPESLLQKFNFTLEQQGTGWQLTGIPKATGQDDLFSQVYFSRLVILLDDQKNVTGLKLYDSLAKEILNVKTTYTEITDIYFPVRTEVFLSASGLKTITEHKQVRLNIPLDPALFDPQKIKGE